MNALLYLRRIKLKNQLKSLVKKPSRLIYVVIIIAALALTLIGGNAADGSAHAVRDILELNAGAAALYLLMFVLTVKGGFSRGGNLFNMSDVNLLFCAPIRPQLLLFHGLLQQMISSLFIGFFILFQYTNLHSAYGISYGCLFLLLLGYGIAIFLGQVTAMLVYSFTNGNETRKRVGKVALYVIVGAFLAYVVASALLGGTEGMLGRGVAAVNSTAFYFLPVIGWLTLAMGGLLTGAALPAVIGFAACVAYLALLVLVIFRMDPDYYEDVLKSAEIAQNAITAQKEGTMTEAVPENVKVGKTGFGRGIGASVFYYKHMQENRRARKFLLSTTSLIFTVTVVLFCLFLKEGGLLATFLMAAYMQMFGTLTGRFNRELLRPYIYLIPEPPMKKMLWAMAELLPYTVMEGVVLFIPVGLILSLNPLEVALCVIARTAVTMVYLAADVVVERIWGSMTSKVLVFFLYFAVTLLLAAPGIAGVCVLAFAFDVTSAVILLGVLSVACVLTSLLALFLCRNMLQYAEMNYQ
jgi:hypothetical protein